MIRAWLSALLVAFAAFVAMVWLGWWWIGRDDGAQIGPSLVVAGGRE
jgi:hypothetical protein